jgi:hypothetical protein
MVAVCPIILVVKKVPFSVVLPCLAGRNETKRIDNHRSLPLASYTIPAARLQSLPVMELVPVWAIPTASDTRAGHKPIWAGRQKKTGIIK